MSFKIIIIFFTFYLIKLTSFAQSADEVLSKFFAIQLDENVFMRWTITAGNTCEDTYIERSSDGISYERIGLIGGICGSPDQSITYEFTDTLPLFNRVTYYRLELGYFGYSSPQQVEIIRYNEQGFFLGPNPFNEYTRFAFRNDLNEDYRLVISDMKGQTVLEMKITGNEFLIRRENLGAGIYLFRIYKNAVITFSGKLLAY